MCAETAVDSTEKAKAAELACFMNERQYLGFEQLNRVIHFKKERKNLNETTRDKLDLPVNRILMSFDCGSPGDNPHRHCEKMVATQKGQSSYVFFIGRSFLHKERQRYGFCCICLAPKSLPAINYSLLLHNCIIFIIKIHSILLDTPLFSEPTKTPNPNPNPSYTFIICTFSLQLLYIFQIFFLIIKNHSFAY